MSRYTYPVGSDQVARINLDEQDARDGYEDARVHYPDVLEGTSLRQSAKQIVNQMLSERPDDLTDDDEEFHARYVAAYCTAYTAQVEQMRAEEG